MKRNYNSLEFDMYFKEDLETLIRLAKDPEVYLSYASITEHDGEDVLFDKGMRFYALVPTELVDEKYKEEDDKYGDDQYDIEINEGFDIQKKIILADLYDLMTVAAKLEKIRKKYVGRGLHKRTVGNETTTGREQE
jgi:hypothetical protein